MIKITISSFERERSFDEDNIRMLFVKLKLDKKLLLFDVSHFILFFFCWTNYRFARLSFLPFFALFSFLVKELETYVCTRKIYKIFCNLNSCVGNLEEILLFAC